MKYICISCEREFTDNHNKRRICHRCRIPWKRCSGCDKRIQAKSKLCIHCSNKQRIAEGNFNWRGGKTKTTKGYILVYYPGHHRNSNNYVFEHILVMEERIGRNLVSGETVHHINGIRDDNRPENLELWVKPHPTGIRVEDAVKWAQEILKLYT
jgi:hypothetical protein